MVIGGVKGKDAHDPTNAMRIQPNTTYEFSFDVSGTIPFTWVRFYQWPKDGQGYYKGRIQLDHNTNGPFLGDPEPVPGKPNWTRYTGTVTTTDDAYYGALRIYIWGRERDYSPGCYLLIDNVVFREKK